MPPESGASELREHWAEEPGFARGLHPTAWVGPGAPGGGSPWKGRAGRGEPEEAGSGATVLQSPPQPAEGASRALAAPPPDAGV